MSRIKEEYRQHTLLAAIHEGKCKGRVWRLKQLIHEQEGQDPESLLVELKGWVDTSISERAAAQGDSPDQEQLLHAFKKVLPELSEKQVALLKAHYEADEQLVTAGDLAKAVGYKALSGANLQYGYIGRALQELSPILLPKRDDGTEIFTYYLAEAVDKTGDEGHWQWKLRPEVSEVIKQLDIAK